MQEEVTQKTIALVIKTAKLDANVLKAAMRAYSARTAHPFRRNGAPFRFKLSKAQQVD